MAIKEQFLSDDQLRTLIAKAKSAKLREGAALLLLQMNEMRNTGGDPVCVLKEDGSASVWDATEM